MSKEDVINDLYKFLLNYDLDGVVKAVNDVVRFNIDPIEAIEKGLAKGIRELGEKFASGEIFIAELMLAAEIMNRALEILRPSLLSRGAEVKGLGRVIIGTVEGDIHDIGKNLVATMLTVSGFDVIDLGADVSIERFIEAVKEYNPDIVAMSALLTTTMINQKKVIDRLKEEKLRGNVKIIIGGAPVTKEWAEEIDADGYGESALEAVNVAKTLLREK
ncbi:MAG: corrinoid protein [Ignisphaera sp.]